MSKRKNRSGAPNLPRETLERARRQANADAAPVPEEEAGSAEIVEQEVTPAPRAVAAPVVSRRATEARAAGNAMSSGRAASTVTRRGRGVRPVTSSGRREMDHNRVASILEHPTKFVSDAELKTEYSYVLDELRQIAIVAVGLLVVMGVLAFVLPR